MIPEQMTRQIALIEAILFVSKEPVEPGRIMEFLGIDDIEEFEKILAAHGEGTSCWSGPSAGCC